MAFVKPWLDGECHYVSGGIPDTSREVTGETHLRLRGYLKGGFPVTYWGGNQGGRRGLVGVS